MRAALNCLPLVRLAQKGIRPRRYGFAGIRRSLRSPLAWHRHRTPHWSICQVVTAPESKIQRRQIDVLQAENSSSRFPARKEVLQSRLRMAIPNELWRIWSRQVLFSAIALRSPSRHPQPSRASQSMAACFVCGSDRVVLGWGHIVPRAWPQE